MPRYELQKHIDYSPVASGIRRQSGHGFQILLLADGPDITGQAVRVCAKVPLKTSSSGIVPAVLAILQSGRIPVAVPGEPVACYTKDSCRGILLCTHSVLIESTIFTKLHKSLLFFPMIKTKRPQSGDAFSNLSIFITRYLDSFWRLLDTT